MWKLAVMKEVTVVEDGGSDGQEKNKERGCWRVEEERRGKW